MNKTTATIIASGLIVGGAVIGLTSDTSAQATVEKIDSSTVRVSQPTDVNIKELKEKIRALREMKQYTATTCDTSITGYQKQIDEIKVIIDEAAKVGVE